MKRVRWLLLAGGCLLMTGGNAPIGESAIESGSIPSNDVEYLRNQYAYFQSLKPARQAQLRKLDADFYALDKSDRDQLTHVVEKYNWWLSQLPEAERTRVIQAETSHERLQIIEEIKEREWVDSLPKSYRDQYAIATLSDRIRLVKEWREEQRLRRSEWQFTRMHWDEISQNKIPNIVQGFDFRSNMQKYAIHLEQQVPERDRDRLRFYRNQPQENREWHRYIRLLVELSDKHLVLPGPEDGPRTWDALPARIREAFEKAQPKVFSTKKKAFPKELQMASSLWPDFAIAITEYASKHRIVLPETFGPVKKVELPLEVQVFMDKTLEPLLHRLSHDRGDKADNARKELARLKEAEGHWPDYPRVIVELAKAHKLAIPAWTMPGKPEAWDNFRLKQGRRINIGK